MLFAFGHIPLADHFTLQCDGQRPSCSACHARSSLCIYEVADGLSRNADLRQKNQLLSNRLVELEQLINRLRFQDDHQATSTLARLRLGDDIRAIIQSGSDSLGDADGVPLGGPGNKRARVQRESPAMPLVRPVPVFRVSLVP